MADAHEKRVEEAKRDKEQYEQSAQNGIMAYRNTTASNGYHVNALNYTSGTTNYNVYIDASSANQSPTYGDWLVPNSLPSTANIGSAHGVNYFNSPIQRLTIYNSALSSGDVSTVTAAIQNGP